jgi:thymidylate synthase
MNKLDKDYQELLKDIIYNGREKGDRTGTGTVSIFGRQIRHKMSDGFPLLTTKKMAFKTMVTELLWFLKGDTNIKYLVENGCNIWNGDAYKRYKEDKQGLAMGMEAFIENIKANDEFARTWGELGPIYGKQWRDWDNIDQIDNLLFQLVANPDGRRLMVSTWNVGEMNDMVLPPCHYGFQVYTRELLPNERKIEWAKSVNKDPSYAYNLSQEDLDDKGFPRRTISLMWNQRSVDTFLGLPFNIASYGLLLLILAKEVNMLPDELIGNLGDVHLYKNHIDQAKEQIERKPFELPTILFKDHLDDFDSIIDILRVKDFILDGYKSHPTIKAPLSN